MSLSPQVARNVILSEAKDLKLRSLRSFAVCAAQDDVEEGTPHNPRSDESKVKSPLASLTPAR